MRRIGVLGVAYDVGGGAGGRNDAELLGPVVDRALSRSGLAPGDIGVLGTAGSEFLAGVVGAVMGAFDALPGWPPRLHSHLEADGAMALYECWVRLLAGEADTALVAAFSRPMAADPVEVLGLQLDPYLVAPLRPHPRALAALQARALLDTGRVTEDDLGRVVQDRRGVRRSGPYVASPLRAADCSSVCSGAAAVVLAAEGARPRPPAWIRAVAHRSEGHPLGGRDLTVSGSTAALAAGMGVAGSRLDVVELHTPFSHQEPILLDALAAGSVGRICPSGGALPADPIMATGLIRIAAAAEAVIDGGAGTALAHATNGPALQQNLLCLMEAPR